MSQAVSQILDKVLLTYIYYRFFAKYAGTSGDSTHITWNNIAIPLARLLNSKIFTLEDQNTGVGNNNSSYLFSSVNLSSVNSVPRHGT